jgi:hypothetical protein
MRSKKHFDFSAQKLIAGTGCVQECSDLAWLVIERGMKDFLNTL